MIKTLLKFMLCVLVYTIVFSIAGAILPFSAVFNEMKSSGGSSLSMLLMLVYAAWICFTMYFIVRHSCIVGKKLLVSLVIVMFFNLSFMTQFETLIFGSAFPALTKQDVFLIMASALLGIAAAAFLIVLFFQNKNAAAAEFKFSIKSILIKLGIIGIIYSCVYFLFGYFVAWQFEELRLFYTGSSANDITQSYAETALRSQTLLFFFQILRGILFGVFILPLKKMIDDKKIFIISVCLVYLGTGFQLILPNPLFPDIVRYAHLIEMTSSMLLFGLIVGFILWRKESRPV